MADLWEVGKKAGVAGVILMSLPVLIPCAFVLAFAGALLAVPVGSAAAGFYACKKLAIFSRGTLLEYHRENHSTPEESLLQGDSEPEPSAGEDSQATVGEHHLEEEQESITSSEFPAEEAPEKGAPPGRVSDDFIVVEKPSSEARASTGLEPGEQCKTPPEHFQSVEAQEYNNGEGNEKPEQDEATRTREEEPGKHSEEPFVEVAQDDEAGKNDDKNEGVGIEVILEDSENHEHQRNNNKKVEPAHVNGSDPAEEEPTKEDSRRSSVDEYVSLAEDFASSDESSVVSSRNSSSKSETTDKEKRARLRKELALVKKVVGCKDASGGALSDQVERLYSFLGVELPSSYQQTNDYEKLLEAMNVLKAVIGVK